MGLPMWLSDKESVCQCRSPDSIPGSERTPVEGNCNPLQYFCLENPMDREAWWSTVHEITKSDMTEHTHTHAHTHTHTHTHTAFTSFLTHRNLGSASNQGSGYLGQVPSGSLRSTINQANADTFQNLLPPPTSSTGSGGLPPCQCHHWLIPPGIPSCFPAASA